MEDAYRVVLVSTPSGDPLEYWYWISQIALTIVAAVTGFVAWQQLRALRRSGDDTLHVARANFLLELDRRWDSPEIVSARQLLDQTLHEVKMQVTADHPLSNDGDKQAKIGREFKLRLEALRAAKDDKYVNLMRLCGFLETAGLMVKKGYMPCDEIFGLFKGAISALDLCFREHIVARQKDPYLKV
jgi:hypothetical protein